MYIKGATVSKDTSINKERFRDNYRAIDWSYSPEMQKKMEELEKSRVRAEKKAHGVMIKVRNKDLEYDVVHVRKDGNDTTRVEGGYTVRT